MKNVLLMDEDGVHHVYECKKFMITYSGGLYAPFKIVFESNDKDEIIREYEKLFWGYVAGKDDVSALVWSDGHSGIGSCTVDQLKKWIEEK